MAEEVCKFIVPAAATEELFSSHETVGSFVVEHKRNEAESGTSRTNVNELITRLSFTTIIQVDRDCASRMQ